MTAAYHLPSVHWADTFSPLAYAVVSDFCGVGVVAVVVVVLVAVGVVVTVSTAGVEAEAGVFEVEVEVDDEDEDEDEDDVVVAAVGSTVFGVCSCLEAASSALTF